MNHLPSFGGDRGGAKSHLGIGLGLAGGFHNALELGHGLSQLKTDKLKKTN